MISVVIPTYNRSKTLMEVLDSLIRQDYPKGDYEVIVVDDGSSDDTWLRLEEYRKRSPIRLNVYRQANAGPAKARNTALDKLSGDIVLFCGDDTICHESLLSQHRRSHDKRPGHAVLGLCLWHASVKPTDFMHYLAPSGPQFHYNTIKNPDSAGSEHFYTCNISLPKTWFQYARFSDVFKSAAFDDIALGLELERRGLKISYNKEAIVFHAHAYVPETFYARMTRVGESLVVLKNKFKGDRRAIIKIHLRYAPFMFFPFGLRLFNLITGVLRKRRLIGKLSQKAYWFINIAYHYSCGILKGLAGSQHDGGTNAG